MIEEAIVLAGGLGTRLQDVVKDIPKPMAAVNGKPFLSYLLGFLARQGLKKVTLSVGYKAEIIENYYEENFHGLSVRYCREKKRLGTGGAILKSLSQTDGKNVFVCNGDTFFKTDLKKIAACHLSKQADVTIGLKKMQHLQRYGTVELNDEDRITDFVEKKKQKSGHINAGIYLINKPWFQSLNKTGKFSFEDEILSKKVHSAHFFGIPSNDYFIDIGVPADYKKAQHDFSSLELL